MLANADLWRRNTPAAFWQCEVPAEPEDWVAAAEQARRVLDLPPWWADLQALPALTLGEGQFGPGHWRLTPARRLYYRFKPFLPRPLTRLLRRRTHAHARRTHSLGWPVEPRYARFLWETMRQLLLLKGLSGAAYRPFWPQGRRFALVLTHDVETAQGLAAVRPILDLEERYGFRSSFNLVPERYPLDPALIDEIRSRGFEIGVHGLKHDGRLFASRQVFARRAVRINAHLKQLGASGFRSPLMLRHPLWLQDLEIVYDLSFFDTDPFEPQPGGTMSIWPFLLGHFVELPYTLVQDYTLSAVLSQTTPQVWLEKVAFIRQYHGMALLNTHPDYLRHAGVARLYTQFLEAMCQYDDCWRALPLDAACWWRERVWPRPHAEAVQGDLGWLAPDGDSLVLS